jgi:hypothetical protein
MHIITDVIKQNITNPFPSLLLEIYSLYNAIVFNMSIIIGIIENIIKPSILIKVKPSSNTNPISYNYFCRVLLDKFPAKNPRVSSPNTLETPVVSLTLTNKRLMLISAAQ